MYRTLLIKAAALVRIWNDTRKKNNTPFLKIDIPFIYFGVGVCVLYENALCYSEFTFWYREFYAFYINKNNIVLPFRKNNTVLDDVMGYLLWLHGFSFTNSYTFRDTQTDTSAHILQSHVPNGRQRECERPSFTFIAATATAVAAATVAAECCLPQFILFGECAEEFRQTRKVI